MRVGQPGRSIPDQKAASGPTAAGTDLKITSGYDMEKKSQLPGRLLFRFSGVVCHDDFGSGLSPPGYDDIRPGDGG